MTKDELKQRARQVLRRLKADYPDATCALHYHTPVQLLVATILSAQCTDERVNIVTKDLFQRYPTAADLAALPLPVLEKAVQSTGFFRNKAKNIQAACRELVERYDGEIPQDLAALVALPGVGRKTANVVLGTAFGLATGVVVDTHVTRLSNRLGLTKKTDAVQIERELMEILPQREWVDFSHRMIHHGRRVCNARKPKCDECSMLSFCPQIGIGTKGAPVRPKAKQASTNGRARKTARATAVKTTKSPKKTKKVKAAKKPTKQAVRKKK